VITLYYQEELNLKEIGAVLGVSESRVCQIQGQSVLRLRARLAEWLEPGTTVRKSGQAGLQRRSAKIPSEPEGRSPARTSLDNWPPRPPLASKAGAVDLLRTHRAIRKPEADAHSHS
jgi:hypothetical protein